MELPNYKVPGYRSWDFMVQRCTNTNNPSYRFYGAKGATVHECVRDFQNFMFWMGPRPEGKTLDRIENKDREYCGCNGKLRWATRKEQDDNKDQKPPGITGERYVTVSHKGRYFMVQHPSKKVKCFKTLPEAVEYRGVL